MENLCISCKKRPIDIKKRGLCKKCYNKMRYDGLGKFKEREDYPFSVDGRVTAGSVRYAKEIEFIRNFFDHKNWLYEPAIFRMDGLRYEPDFYDGERGVFIEVAGTRQAFSKNKEKYIKFTNDFPLLKFEIRHVDGTLIDVNKGFAASKK